MDEHAKNILSNKNILVTRGIFYAARMISAQKNTEFTGDNYGNKPDETQQRLLSMLETIFSNEIELMAQV